MFMQKFVFFCYSEKEAQWAMCVFLKEIFPRDGTAICSPAPSASPCMDGRDHTVNGDYTKFVF